MNSHRYVNSARFTSGSNLGFGRAPGGMLQRRCACGTHTIGSECKECKRNKRLLQRSSLSVHERGSEGEGTVPPIVHEVLRSPGQPLDPATRSFFKPWFGYDFSKVRVHTDAKAAESARAMNAAAYTAGRDIVFGSGRYEPQAREGRRLLAHELTHVLQQRNEMTTSTGNWKVGPGNTPEERESQIAEDQVASDLKPASVPSLLSSGRDNLVRRQPDIPGPSPFLGQTNLAIDERGRITITGAGPATTPVVSSPTIGIRRDPNGQLHLLAGGKDKVIGIDEVPALLRQAVGGQTGGPSKAPVFRVPTCAQLMLYGGKERNRFMTFEQYETRQKLFHNQIGPLAGDTWLPLTRTFFEALIGECMTKLMQLPRPEPAEKPSPGDFPEKVLPEGSKYA